MKNNELPSIVSSNIPSYRDNLSRSYIAPERNPSHVMLSDLMGAMTSHQLFLMADYFESQGLALRSRALHLAHQNVKDEVFDRRREYVAVEAPRAVRRYLRQGKALPDALAAASAVTGILRETVEWHWKAWLRLKTDAQRSQRDNLIYDMAQSGLEDATIGKAFGLHEKSVSRILKGLRQKRGLTRARRGTGTALAHDDCNQAESHAGNSGLEAASHGERLPHLGC